MTNVGTSLLPIPTTMAWQIHSPRPPASTLVDLGLTAAEVAPVAELEQAEERMREAVYALSGARPGGGAWSAALQADVDLVAAGKPAVELAKLINGDVGRWGQAVAATNLVGTLAAEFGTSTGGAGVAVRKAAAHRAQAKMTAISAEIEELVVEAWPYRADRAEAWAARRDADELCAPYAVASNVAAWAAGNRWNPSGAVIPRGKAGGYLTALRSYLDGSQLLVLNPAIEYPPDFQSEPREPRQGSMLLEGQVLEPQGSGRRRR